MPNGPLLLRDAEIFGVGRRDLRIENGVVAQLGRRLPGRGETETEIDADGGALLPGLHDHHLHILAMAAAAVSTPCGPPTVNDVRGLAQALTTADPHSAWVRGVGYHESVAGPLDRHGIDAFRSDVPVRIQHRSGALWTVNTAGLRLLGIIDTSPGGDAEPRGIERDASGRATGRLWRLDTWLGRQLGPSPEPDLARVSRALADVGITGVTDATADLPPSAVARLRGTRSFRQRIVLLGDATGSQPFKIVVPDHELPPFDTLRDCILKVRPRPVALHCVTRAALALILAVLSETGAVRGDRLEHAAVVPPEFVPLIAGRGLVVVTQPSLPGQRGDDYLDGAEKEDVEHLWPYRSLLAGGVPVACSSDAPYGDADPWTSILAATRRRTLSGRLIAGGERVSALTALRGYLSPADDPGGPPRRVEVGAPADLVLLDRPLTAVLAEPSSDRVRHTLIAGEVAPGGRCRS